MIFFIQNQLKKNRAKSLSFNMQKTVCCGIVVVLCIVLTTFFVSCGSLSTGKSPEAETVSTLADSSIYIVISFDPSSSFPFSNKCKKANLTSSEISDIDLLLKKCVEDYNSSLKDDKKAYFGIDLIKEKYKRQYVPVVNERGEKEIWVNCFCRDFDGRWRKDIIHVDDGGNCFFNFKINLTKKKCYEFFVNGLA